ncbi:MAG TPA: class I adenylate cyclase [Spirochaetota bacterium]|nr:class I adenylate cyclase [Spirochaetota bacterium]HPI90775.1 class I adenylate cyclase [Spirochaetota bacterium]HPR47503.1 class I adenylate cyclase [Spirochaetota bacterium]
MSIQEKLQTNYQYFQEYNKHKYERFQQLIINSTVRKIINAIPFLLSVNEKKLPGYVEGDVPYGIARYEPDEETKKFLQGKFHIHSIALKKEKPFIEMLAVMGSVGTIAYSKKSDFDYWVCIDKGSVTRAMLDNFQKKVDEIQKWAIKEMQLDVHLFINDIENVKDGIFAEDEDEAFGSTVGAVLKDEFFRSSIIIAGKTPFWWILPRFARDSDYEKIYAEMTEDFREQFLDLGNLYEISKTDFLGAALFQIIKSLGNPFKSIIKIGVLEKYLFGPEESPLLSQKVKSFIQRGDFDNKILDSYILMFEEVYDYYESVLEDRQLLKILRQNLYLKIDPQLSKYLGIKNSQNLPYKVMVMFKYVKEWKWTGREVRELDNFDNWDYNKIIGFWTQVQKFMLLSYQKIAVQLPSINLEKKISDSDFKLLSRKIKTYFSSEDNKIDHYITFKDTPFESIIYIEPSDTSIDTHEWRLYKRNTELSEQFATTTLKTDSNFIKLLAWTGINQIFNPTFSRLKIQSGYNRINPNLVVDLLTKIASLFSGKGISLRNDYFLNPAFNLVNMVIINFNIENVDTIKTISYIYRTSWGESYIEEYHSDADLISILSKILNDGFKQKRPFDEYVVIDTPEPFKRAYKDIERLFRQAYEFIILGDKYSSLRLVSQLGNQYISINSEKGSVTVKPYANFIQFLTANSLTPRNKIAYSFYGENLHVQILKEIYDQRRPRTLTVVYEEKGNLVFIYVVNESGNIFTFNKPKTVLEETLVYTYSFCRNVISQLNAKHSKPVINEIINFNKLNIDKFGNFSIVNESKRIEDVYLLKYQTKRTLSAEIMKHHKTQPLYCVKNSDGTSTEMVPLKDISREIKEGKVVIQSGSVIIDEIKIRDLTSEDAEIGSSLYFVEKYRLETLLERAQG